MFGACKKQEKAEIIAGHVAALKKLKEAMAAREELRREEIRRAREIQRKKDWQLSELARIEEGSEMKKPIFSNGNPPAGYGGYLDGYCGVSL
jgi:hypothetical protein